MVTGYVSDTKMVDETTVVVPKETTSEDLLVVHTQSYLDSLRVSSVCSYV